MLNVLISYLESVVLTVMLTSNLAISYARFLASPVGGMTCLINVTVITSAGVKNNLVINIVSDNLKTPAVNNNGNAAIVATMLLHRNNCGNGIPECNVLNVSLVRYELTVQIESITSVVVGRFRRRVNVMSIILTILMTTFTVATNSTSKWTLLE